MGETGQDHDISSIEELDAAPVVDARSIQRRELLLGLGLLVIIIGLAGWNWWQGEVQFAATQAAYRAGAAAATAHHWDEAHTQFQAAGSYADARARAAEAATQSAERDKQYRIALTALGQYDGVKALQAVDAVDKIEAGFGGTTLLRSEANSQLYRSALAGVVARRLTASPPGLYYRTADDWAWLQGSDTTSSPHNYDNGDTIVYDVPLAGAPPLARRLMAAHLSGGSLSFTPIALDPRANVFWGTQGGWSYEYGCSGSVSPQVRSYYCAAGLVYTAIGSVITTSVTLPGPNWIVLDLAQDGSKMLVADSNPVDYTTAMYLAAPDGSQRQLLYTDSGEIERAAFSQDGRYVVAMLGTSDPQTGTSYKALLFDLARRAAPQVLSTGIASLATPVGIDFVLLSGAGSGKVALAQYGSGQTLLQVVDLGNGQKDAGLRWVGRQFATPLLATRTDDGGVAVCGQVAGVSDTLDPLNAHTGECILLGSGAAQVTSFALPQIARYGIGYAWPRQGAIIYPIATPGAGAAGMSILRIDPTRAGTPQSTVILQLPLSVGESFNVVAGAGLLAYARHGQLHVRSYDGSFDLLLEEGVDTLYDIRGAASIAVLF